jgi:hypothetical protein
MRPVVRPPKDRVSRTHCRVCSVRNLQLQKSPSRISGQISGNSVDISKAFLEVGISKFESSRVSQPVRRSEKLPLILAERPANGGLLHICGQSPDSDFGHSQSKIADSLRRTLGKFPFWEIAAGDRVRSALRGRACSAIRQILPWRPRANWGMPRSHFHETVRRQDGQRE